MTPQNRPGTPVAEGAGTDPTPRPASAPRPLTRPQAELLATLASLDGDLLDLSETNVSMHVFAALRRRNLAKPASKGLWRITLAGLLAHRGKS